MLGLSTRHKLHDLVDLNLGDVSIDTLIVSVLAGAEAAFHVHHVAFGIVAALFGNVVGQIAPGNQVVPLGLVHPVVVAVAITLGGGQGDRHFSVSALECGDLRVFPETANEDDFV